MKKTNILLASLFAGIVLASCGSKAEEKKEEGTADTTTTEAVTEPEEDAASEEFVSEDGGFSINFKSKPSEQTQPVQTAAGNVTMHMFMYEESSTKVYMMAYCDFPKDQMQKDVDRVSVLNSSKEGVISKFSAKVTEEKTGKFMGHDAIDFLASGPQYHTSYKILLVDNRLYQIGILQTGGPVSQEETDQFIGTFKLLNAGESKAE